MHMVAKHTVAAFKCRFTDIRGGIAKRRLPAEPKARSIPLLRSTVASVNSNRELTRRTWTYALCSPASSRRPAQHESDLQRLTAYGSTSFA